MARPALFGGRRAFSTDVWPTETTQRDLEEIELAYAGYHVLNLFAYEALGILEVMRQNNPDMTDDLRWRLLYAAANILAERPEPAEDILEDSDLLLYQEGQLWNAALHAIGKDWELANLYFERSEDVLNRYPPRLQARLGLLRIESALRQNRHALARIWERHLNALRFTIWTSTSRRGFCFISAGSRS